VAVVQAGATTATGAMIVTTATQNGETDLAMADLAGKDPEHPLATGDQMEADPAVTGTTAHLKDVQSHQEAIQEDPNHHAAIPAVLNHQEAIQVVPSHLAATLDALNHHAEILAVLNLPEAIQEDLSLPEETLVQDQAETSLVVADLVVASPVVDVQVAAREVEVDLHRRVRS